MKNSATTTIATLSSLLLLLSPLVSCDPPPASSLQDKCAPEFAKLGACLGYASGKADAPTGPCCASVAEIRGDDAACLCYIIQQAHAGGPSVSSLGLQMDRLVTLASACRLANTRIGDCPKLLNLPPNSPDYAMFTNATGAATTPTASGSSSGGGGGTSGGVVNKIGVSGVFTVAIVSVLCSVIV